MLEDDLVFISCDVDNKKVIDKITANSNYDDGQKKILIEAYTKFGAATLAESMVNNG